MLFVLLSSLPAELLFVYLHFISTARITIEEESRWTAYPSETSGFSASSLFNSRRLAPRKIAIFSIVL